MTNDPTSLTRRRALAVLCGGGAAIGLGGLAACEPVPGPLVGPSPWATAPQVTTGLAGWCWFSPERSTIDGRGIHHSGGAVIHPTDPARGDVVVDAVELASLRHIGRAVVGHSAHADDHAAPSLTLPDGPLGPVQVGFAPHTILVEDAYLALGTVGGMRKVITGALGQAYASAAHTADGTRYVFTRQGPRWILLRSRDLGRSWTNLGAAVLGMDAKQSGQTYRPYHFVVSSGHELHVIVTSGNASEFPYGDVVHCIVRPDLTVVRSNGTPIGRVGSAPAYVTDCTRIWSGYDRGLNAVGWQSDVRFIDGEPTAILSVRDTVGNPDLLPKGGNVSHRYIWARRQPNGTWHTEHLAWAGSELYGAQPDYTGLGAIDPADPNRVVISTNAHPETQHPLASTVDGRPHWELWDGTRSSDGAWSWSPITENSAADNLRPHLATGAGFTALTAMVGSYAHYNSATTSNVVRVLRSPTTGVPATAG